MAKWNPSNMTSTLTAWYKADSLSLNDGDGVGAWTDSSGNGHTVAQLVAIRKPTFEANELNSKPVIRFDGTNDILSDGDIAALDVGTGDIWMGSVFKSIADLGAQFFFEKKATEFGLITTAAGVLQARLGGTTNIPSQSAGNWSRTEFVMVTASRVSSSCNGFVNGSDMTTTGTTNSGSISNSHVFDIGASAVGGQTTTGDIAEILVGGGTLLESERLKIESYLDDKYGLDNLPSTHEYKDFVAAIGVHGVHNQDLLGELVLDVSGPVVSDTLAGVV